MALHLRPKKMAVVACIRRRFLLLKQLIECKKLLLNGDSYLYLHQRLYMLRNHNFQNYEHINYCKKLNTSGSRHTRSHQISHQPHFKISGRDFVLWKSSIICPLEEAFSGECRPIIRKCQSSNSKSSLSFDAICEETLDSLANYFEDLIGIHLSVADTDVTLSDGVLTVNLGINYGIYVINKQGPNQQIWLSSPISGPKRYDFVENQWIYRRDGISLHQLLTKEISEALNTNVDFTQCNYSK